jgi:hypothetical protein
MVCCITKLNLALLLGHPIHEVKDVTQNEINTAKQLGTQTGVSGLETAIKKLKTYKLPGTDQILKELIRTRGRVVHSEIYKLSTCTLNKEEFQQQHYLYNG